MNITCTDSPAGRTASGVIQSRHSECFWFASILVSFVVFFSFFVSFWLVRVSVCYYVSFQSNFVGNFDHFWSSFFCLWSFLSQHLLSFLRLHTKFSSTCVISLMLCLVTSAHDGCLMIMFSFFCELLLFSDIILHLSQSEYLFNFVLRCERRLQHTFVEN